MKQSEAEHKLKEALQASEVKGIYNTAKEYEQIKPLLLDALQRQTQLPKSQIVNYLNKKGFDYEANIQRNTDEA